MFFENNHLQRRRFGQKCAFFFPFYCRAADLIIEVFSRQRCKFVSSPMGSEAELKPAVNLMRFSHETWHLVKIIVIIARTCYLNLGLR